MKLIAEDYLGERGRRRRSSPSPRTSTTTSARRPRTPARIAGLDVIRIINEPTAAALAYGFGKNIEQARSRSTTSAAARSTSRSSRSAQTASSRSSRRPATRSSAARTSTQRIIDWLVARLQASEHGIDLRQDRMALQRLKDAAEKAKCELSSVKRDRDQPAVHHLDAAQRGAAPAAHAHARQARGAHRATSSSAPIDICARDARRSASSTQDEIEDVDPRRRHDAHAAASQHAVAEFFGREPCKGVHPDEVVALGAAIQGAALVDETQRRCSSSTSRRTRSAS